MNRWKITAIIFIILFTLETAFFTWAIVLATNEENKINECYYEICNEYPDALREDNLCYCYDYDVLGNLQIVKTELMK